MEESEHEALPGDISEFASTHCMTCAYGWTRHGRRADGREGVVIWCLLDRQAVWEEMIFCDRYEVREPLDD